MFKALFGFIVKFLKKIWKKLRKWLAILLVVAAVIFCVWALLIYVGALAATSVVVAGATVSITAGSAVAIGAVALSGAYLVDSETAGKAVDKVGDAVGSAGKAAGRVVGKGVGGIAGGLFSTPFGIALLAVGAFMLFGGGDKNGKSDSKDKGRNIGPQSSRGRIGTASEVGVVRLSSARA